MNRYAIKIARYLSISPPTYQELITRKLVIESWFGENSPPDVKKEASDYLKENGTTEDYVTLNSIADINNSKPISQIDEISISIRLRHSLTSALNDLIERDPDLLGDHIVDQIFSSVKAITSDILISMLKLKSSSIRLRAARELRRRGNLSLEQAEELSGDNSPEVRYEAIIALLDSGAEVSETRAKNALEKRSPGNLIGLGIRRDDDKLFERYQRHILSLKTLPELNQLSGDESAHTANAFFAACVKYPKQTNEKLRLELESGFRERFNAKLSDLNKKYGDTASELISKTRDLGEFIANRHTDEGLHILSTQMQGSDLRLVRHVIDSWEVTASKSILAYLRRFGDWSDVDRVLRLRIANRFSPNFAPTSSEATVYDVGHALRVLGRKRISDLLLKDLDPTIKDSVYRALSIKEINQIDDDRVIPELNTESDLLRKTVALRCVESFTKSRLRKLLDRYINSDEYRYYNVIHWLDLGVSMPRSIAKAVVRSELAEI